MSELLLTYYGDDLTGSTDVLEALASNGVPTVLFLRPPEPGQLARFSDCRAVGLAGVSRSQSPAWMDENLPLVFQRLKALGAPLCHYKVCSTFDSSPEIGSIGRALEIGQQIFGNPFVPVVVSVPVLGRYVIFGHLFAKAGPEIYRIDRHPTMSRHPVTPMTESDLRLHLARQTGRKIALVDILAIRDGEADRRLEELVRGGAEVILFDGLDEESLEEVGRLVWSRCSSAPMFAVGSSGLSYALIAHWRRAGWLPPKPVFPDPGPVDRLIVASGSCSPVTERQIRRALARGFCGVRVAPGQDIEALKAEALQALAAGRSAVLYSALGPEDRREGISPEWLSAQLGAVIGELVERSGVRRVVVAGGDTASHLGRRLRIFALTLLRPLDPGTPLCRAHSEDPRWDGVELVFKGGQVGSEDFFSVVERGTP